jgi:endoglucanase
LVPNSSRAKKEFIAGRNVTFSDGTVRMITNTKEDGASFIVFLDGAPLDGHLVGYPNKLFVGTDNK